MGWVPVYVDLRVELSFIQTPWHWYSLTSSFFNFHTFPWEDTSPRKLPFPVFGSNVFSVSVTLWVSRASRNVWVEQTISAKTHPIGGSWESSCSPLWSNTKYSIAILKMCSCLSFSIPLLCWRADSAPLPINFIPILFSSSFPHILSSFHFFPLQNSVPSYLARIDH